MRRRAGARLEAGAIGMKVAKVVRTEHAGIRRHVSSSADDPRLDSDWAMARGQQAGHDPLSDSIGRLIRSRPSNERTRPACGGGRENTENSYRERSRRTNGSRKARENMHRRHPQTASSTRTGDAVLRPEKVAAFLDTYPNATSRSRRRLQDLGRAPRLGASS